MIHKLTKRQLTPWLILGVIIFALIVRAYQVGSLPKILNRDEAALAYNAYLLDQAGVDEWQKSWPLSFKSFGDYKLPGYIYTLVGFFQLLPPSDWVVRLPSVLAGTGLTVVAYFLAKKIGLSLRYGLILAGLTATSPVFIFFSRMAFEANLALVFFVSGLILLLRENSQFIKNNVNQISPYLLTDLLAIILILAAVLTYNTPLLLLPFVIISLPFLRQPKKIKAWLVPVLGLSLVSLFGAYQLFAVSSQKSGITIFQDETIWQQSVQYRQQFTGPSQTLIGNRYFYYSLLIGQNYLKSLSPQFLIYGQGGHPWHSIPNQGHSHVIVYGLAVIGFIIWSGEILYNLAGRPKKIFKGKVSKKIKFKVWLLYLTLISLLPAVVTVDAPHATRSLLFFLLLLVWAVVGFKKIDRAIFNQRRHIWLWLIIILVAVETSSYLRSYFYNYPQQQAVLKPNFAETIQQVENQSSDQAVAIIDPDGYQYILLAWYLKLSPEKFFETVIKQQPDKIGLQYGEQVGRYHFIVDEADRTESEEIMVKWLESNQSWQIKEY